MGKNQHFVPRFCLRYFSSDERKRCICLYNKNNNRYISNASIKSQASRDNFYDGDGSIEGSLDKIESIVSVDINNILKKNGKIAGYDKAVVEFYMIFLYLRNAKVADSVESSLDELMKILYLPTVPYDKRPKIDAVKIGIKNSGAFSLGYLEKYSEAISDLNVVLIKNKTKFELITSDSPLVMYNSFLERRKYLGSLSAFGLSGVQIFLPLTPYCLAVAYDGDVYKISKSILDGGMTNSLDVFSLNRLQIMNSIENIYARNEQSLRNSVVYAEKCIHNIVQDGGVSVASEKMSSRKEERVFEVCEDYVTREVTKSELLIVSNGSLRLNFGVTFISIKNSAKKKILPNVPIRPSCPVK